MTAAALVACVIVFPSVNPADALATLGIGSVAVGFAFKDILQNLFAGVLLLLRRPFRRGDQIVVKDYEGTVEHIESRATHIKTYDGRRVIIPNSDIYTSPVTVNTAFPIRRDQFDVGIGYGDDVDLATRVDRGGSGRARFALTGAHQKTECAACHQESGWKQTTRFDHDRSSFPLRGAHLKPDCKACHTSVRYKGAPSDCYSCHKKDDKHEGQEGTKCESCHNDKSWKDTRFDHGQSRFPLTGKHIVLACKKCHETARYKDAPRDCYGCHRKDDQHKLKFGVKCENCHNTRSWGLWNFDHNVRTSYKLDGAHRKVACESCHREPAPRGKDAATVGSSCIGCHRKEDIHDGQFGNRCEQCHSTDNWKNFKNRIGVLFDPERSPASNAWLARN